MCSERFCTASKQFRMIRTDYDSNTNIIQLKTHLDALSNSEIRRFISTHSTMLSERFGDVFGVALKQFHTIRVDYESNANRIRFEIETASHDYERQYESNTVRNSHRRTKQFVCLPDFNSTHEAMLSERFGDVIRFEPHRDSLSNSYVH